MWLLRATGSGEAPPLQFRLTSGSMKTMGRAARADFIVDTGMVSRLHCRLTATESGHLEVEDLGSTNGTWVNERRVERAVLVPGDRLRVGRLELVVELDQSPAGGQAERSRA